MIFSGTAIRLDAVPSLVKAVNHEKNTMMLYAPCREDNSTIVTFMATTNDTRSSTLDVLWALSLVKTQHLCGVVGISG